ncbi:hypothetical protein IV454_11805 [Massilia antarctica]|uniref:Uncharacterized protein n=1 Tax=Massilia antarctica TaxID=2765360 RepID=A0AA48WGY5_9BURK|nr:hypothetical protein [Massilia antarctica]QPI52118.1 hypothetical protein IV454_11805 [Massilia antarctica]
MNYFSSRPLQAKNRRRGPSRPAALTSAASATTAGAGNFAATGQAQQVGVTAFADKPLDVERASTTLPGTLLRKRARWRLKRLLVRPVGQALEALIDRRVEEKLAQRLPAPSPAVAAARERGNAWAREEYAKVDNLTLDQAAEQSGVSGRIVNERRNDGKYYALLPHGQQRGYRFPRWQFGAPADRLSTVLQITCEASVSGWGIHIFMISPSHDLEGMAPREWIADPSKDLNKVLQVARARFTSDQGGG